MQENEDLLDISVISDYIKIVTVINIILFRRTL